MLWWLQELQYERRMFNIHHVRREGSQIESDHDAEDLIDLSDDSGLLTNVVDDKKATEGSLACWTLA